MKKALFICLSMRVTVCPQTQSISFLREFGTPERDFGSAIAADATGIFVVGTTEGVFPGQTSAGGGDGFIRKCDSSGNELWTRQFGAASWESAQGVAAHTSGIYIAGASPSQARPLRPEAFVRKYDASGNELWTRHFGSSEWFEAGATAIVADSTGVYAVGRRYGPVPGGGVGGSIYPVIRKYDHSGRHVWTHLSGPDGIAWGVTATAGGVYVVGWLNYDAFIRKYDVNGNVLWTRKVGLQSEGSGVAADDTGIYMAGTTRGNLPGQTGNNDKTDAFVRKYDASGNVLWTRQFGTTEWDYGTGVTADATGIYVAGSTRGSFRGQTMISSVEPFVRKYDTDGNEVWTRQFPEFLDPRSTLGYVRVASDSAGIFVTGTTYADRASQQSFSGDTQIFLARFERTMRSPIVNLISKDRGLTNPNGLTTDGSALFIISRSGLPRNSGLLTMPISGGVVTTLYTNLRSPLGITTIGNNLFWIDPDSGPVTDTQILAAPKDGSKELRPIYTGSAAGQPIADGSGLTSDGTSLFTVDQFQGRVHRLNPDGSGLTQLGSRWTGGIEANRSQQIDESSGILYIVDAGRRGVAVPGVFSLPKSGGTFRTLHAGSPFVCPSSIAVRDANSVGLDHVFVADPCANTLWGLPRAGASPTALLSGPPFVSIAGLVFHNDVLYATDSGKHSGVDGPGAIYQIVPRVCDPDWDGDVDNGDVGQVFAGRNAVASGPNDARDMNKDGFITVEDARKCTLLCTKPNCAP